MIFEDFLGTSSIDRKVAFSIFYGQLLWCLPGFAIGDNLQNLAIRSRDHSRLDAIPLFAKPINFVVFDAARCTQIRRPWLAGARACRTKA